MTAKHRSAACSHTPFAIAALIVSIPLLTGAAQAKILEQWNFEGAEPFAGLKIEGEKPTVVADPVDANNHVMQEVLRTSSERPERSEVRWDSIGYGQERWVAVRILAPEACPQGFISLFQIGPIKNPADKEGKGFLQLQLVSGGQNWLTRIFLERINLPRVAEKAGEAALGRWESWVMHFRLADDSKGFVEVWRNGKKVYDGKGPNAKAGDKLPLKWGPYIGKGNKLVKDCRYLYDDVVLGDEKSSYEEVTKAQAKPSATGKQPASAPGSPKK